MLSTSSACVTDHPLQLDSPFQLQEHLKAQYSKLTHTETSDRTIPITKETALQLIGPPLLNETESVDRNLWLYELCRFLTQKANIVSIFLMNDTPACSSQTCPEMRASEWQYLCAVHDPPKSCCAIDYCNHTLDWAANVLTSPRNFPSRLALGGESGTGSMKNLTNIFRRVYRIFAHAWFQHRDIFWSVENTYGLYMFFKTVCDEYRLIPEDSYTIPREAEGFVEESNGANKPSSNHHSSSSQVQILRKDGSSETALSSSPDDTTSADLLNTGATARRHKHKHTPSTGSLVDTITEGQEDEDESSSAAIEPTESSTQLGIPPQLPAPSEAPPKHKEPSPDRQLLRLDISATVPKYDPRAPEDPTPTPTTGDVDPMSVIAPKTTDNSSAGAESDVTTEVSSTIEKKENNEDDEEVVTSPSGGSIRTAGSDVLDAILDHISDGDEEEEERERERRNSAATEMRAAAERARLERSAGDTSAVISSPEPRVEVTAIEDDDDDGEKETEKAKIEEVGVSN